MLATWSGGRSSRLTVLALALVSTLAGCTGPVEYVRNGFKVGPNYHKPSAPVSTNWIDSQDHRVDSSKATDCAWWRVFNDERLNRLIQLSYEQNLTLREAGFRIMEARARRAIAAGDLFPQQQQAFGSYLRNQISVETANTQLAPGLKRNFSLITLGGQLAWEIDFWGKFRRAVEAADAALDASVENYDDALVLLLSEVASAYVEIRTLEERLRLARDNVKSQRGSLDLTQTKLGGGAASRLDVAQALTNLAQTEATIPQLENELREVQNRLCVLLGMPPQDISRLLDGESHIPQTPPEVAVGVPADLLRRRPDVRAAERLVAAQSAAIGIVEADLYPAFSINGNIAVQADQFNRLFRSSAVAGNVGPSFNWNLLNYGRLRNAVVVEQARYFQQVTSYQNIVLNANREAENAIVSFLRSQERARVLREGVAAAEESRDLVTELYRGGRADFGRVFVAELFLAQQQDTAAQAEGDIALALVEIYRSLGGGWQIRLPNGGACGPVADATTPAPSPTAPPLQEKMPPQELVPPKPDAAPVPKFGPQVNTAAPGAMTTGATSRTSPAAKMTPPGDLPQNSPILRLPEIN